MPRARATLSIRIPAGTTRILDAGTVKVRGDASELPGRCFVDQWRFSRRAVLTLLDGADGLERTPSDIWSSLRAQREGNRLRI